MSIPIIFIHTGDPFYLNFSLNQAHLSNPENPIFLITDEITDRYDFVKYIDIHSWKKDANDFKRVYRHMSTNPYEGELFCFQRWFILKQFCVVYSIDRFLYLDSDLMLYCNINEVFPHFDTYQFTITNQQGPQCTYFSSVKYLKDFCEFMTRLYTDEKYVGRFEKKHQHHLDNNEPGGVCDMTVFIEYQNDHPGCAKDLSLIENNCVFDDNFNESQGFEMTDIGKKIIIKNKMPYGKHISSGKEIQFNDIHFQGPAKKYMSKYYLGNNLKKMQYKVSMDLFLMNHYFLYRVFRKLGYKLYPY
ncbi:MAG: hypothetical protein K0S53_2561 [Bacteroidetes bacterium]|jgi:hypothetical protein|nr:hypothetical protein [Bacteroidota bacterium]MDF2453910.1 hypothetical protein [Bacteroidota bacterium]